MWNFWVDTDVRISNYLCFYGMDTASMVLWPPATAQSHQCSSEWKKYGELAWWIAFVSYLALNWTETFEWQKDSLGTEPVLMVMHQHNSNTSSHGRVQGRDGFCPSFNSALGDLGTIEDKAICQASWSDEPGFSQASSWPTSALSAFS